MPDITFQQKQSYLCKNYYEYMKQLGTLENMYVQYDCHRPSTFRDLLRKRSARQNV